MPMVPLCRALRDCRENAAPRAGSGWNGAVFAMRMRAGASEPRPGAVEPCGWMGRLGEQPRLRTTRAGAARNPVPRAYGAVGRVIDRSSTLARRSSAQAKSIRTGPCTICPLSEAPSAVRA